MKKRLAHLLRSAAHRLDPQSPFFVIHNTLQNTTSGNYSITIDPKTFGGPS